MEAMVHHQMVTIVIHHYKSLLVIDFECHYNTYTFGDTTFGDVHFFVTEAMVYHHFSYEMVMFAIRYYKSLLVTDFEFHYNTYTFGDIQFLVTKALLTITNVLFSCSITIYLALNNVGS